MKNAINWSIFTILLVLSLLSVIFVFPYVVTLQKDAFDTIGQPIAFIFFAQLIQSAILFSIIIYFGLLLTKNIGFQLPLLKAISTRSNKGIIIKDIVGISILSGIITAIAIYTLDIFFGNLGVAITIHQTIVPPWQSILAAFYGGITEEIVMRLFVMSFFIWSSMKIVKHKEPTKSAIVISILIAAVVFGLGHLPITASLVTITTATVVRAIVLNGVGGIVFGWLFWKKGLESAMIAHFTTDIVLLTVLPLLF